MTLTDRERYIVLFLHGLNSEEDNSKTFTKMEQYGKILNLDVNDVEAIQIMHELDDMMLDIIELENMHLMNLKKIQEDLKN